MEEIDGYMKGNDAVLEDALAEFDKMMKKTIYEVPKHDNPKRKQTLDTLKE